MSTRSLIGIVEPNGSIRHIYCHFDGYPEGVGKCLLDHYHERSKVDALMALGDLSQLGPEIGDKHDFRGPTNGACTAYGRDRGEAGTESRGTANVQEFVLAADRCVSYAYLFDSEGRWLVHARHEPAPMLRVLAEVLAEVFDDERDEPEEKAHAAASDDPLIDDLLTSLYKQADSYDAVGNDLKKRRGEEHAQFSYQLAAQLRAQANAVKRLREKAA